MWVHIVSLTRAEITKWYPREMDGFICGVYNIYVWWIYVVYVCGVCVVFMCYVYISDAYVCDVYV